MKRVVWNTVKCRSVFRSVSKNEWMNAFIIFVEIIYDDNDILTIHASIIKIYLIMSLLIGQFVCRKSSLLCYRCLVHFTLLLVKFTNYTGTIRFSINNCLHLNIFQLASKREMEAIASKIVSKGLNFRIFYKYIKDKYLNKSTFYNLHLLC